MAKDRNWDEKAEKRWAGKIERFSRKWFYRLASIWFGNKNVLEEFSWDKIDRILIIKEPYRMGDLMQITPALRALKQTFPKLFIGLVIQDRNFPIFRYNPHVDRIFLYEKKKFNYRPWSLLKFFGDIRGNKFQLAVTLETQRAHLTNDLIAFFSGAPYRLRYDGAQLDSPESNAFYNLLVPYYDEGHETERNFGVFKKFGLNLKDRSLNLRVSRNEKEKAASLAATLQEKWGIPKGSGLIVIHPGAFKLDNRWPLSNYLAVAEKLKQRKKIVFLLGPSEREMEPEIKAGGFEVVTDLSILEMAALFEKSESVLCNDTGIMHLAAGVGAKTLALFGSTDPSRWKPAGVFHIQSQDQKVSSISIAEVENALETLVLKIEGTQPLV